MGKKRKKGQSTTPPPAETTSAAPPVAEATPEQAVVEVRASAIPDEVPPSTAPKAEAPKAEASVEPPKVEPVATVAAVAETVPAAPAVEASPASEAPESETAPESELEPESTTAPPSAVSADGVAKPKKKRKKRVVKKTATKAALDQKIDALEAKLADKKEEAAKAAEKGFGKAAEEEDTSVPPVDLEVHDEFFEAGERGPQTRDASGSFAGLDPRHAQKLSAAAHARRAHLSRYVKWAVGGSVAILALGLTFNKLRSHPSAEPVRQEVVHAAAPPPVETQAQQAPKPEPSVIELADQGNMGDQPNAAGDGGKAADDKTDETATDEVKKPEDMPAEKPKNAWQEKQSAKAALERGANGAAVQAGERSVALDPSDGEAWLVLGGAYQAMGNNAQAKRCYNACVSQGKKGPISDCKDMLSSL